METYKETFSSILYTYSTIIIKNNKVSMNEIWTNKNKLKRISMNKYKKFRYNINFI